MGGINVTPLDLESMTEEASLPVETTDTPAEVVPETIVDAE